MSKIQKIIRKLNQGSGNLTFAEIVSLLEYLGYQQDNKGKTSGSRVRFYQVDRPAIIFHKPHPRKTLLEYQIKQIKKALKKEGLL